MESQNSVNVSSASRFAEAFRRVESELATLKEEELTTINIDVPSAVGTVFGALPRLRQHRPALEKLATGFDMARFDRLEDYTGALSHAHVKYATAIEPPDNLKALYEQGSKARETLQSDVASLVHRGLVSKDTLDDLSGSTGYKNVATDLQILTSVLQDNWAKIEGRTAIDRAELDRLVALAEELVLANGQREQSPESVALATSQRARAFTLLLRAYDDVRRAIIYLRWHDGDADVIAPSLFKGRTKGKRKDDDDAPIADTVVSPAAPPAAGATSTLPGGLVLPVAPPAAPAGSNGAGGPTPSSGGPFA